MIVAHWDVPQHTENEWGQMIPTQAWFNLRHGKITGTGLVKIMGLESTRTAYLRGLAWSIKRKPRDAENSPIGSKDMQRGLQAEPFAIPLLEQKLGIQHRECAFITLNDYIGLSPDFVNEDLTIACEIKSLQEIAMAEVVYENKIPAKHWDQVVGYFLIPTMKAVVYACFCPAEEMANEEPFLHTILVTREQVVNNLAAMKVSLKESIEVIKHYRSL